MNMDTYIRGIVITSSGSLVPRTCYVAHAERCTLSPSPSPPHPSPSSLQGVHWPYFFLNLNCEGTPIEEVFHHVVERFLHPVTHPDEVTAL